MQTAVCPKCSNAIRPHHACTSCGHYRDKNVLNLQEKVEKKIVKKTAPKVETTPETAPEASVKEAAPKKEEVKKGKKA